jgi:hypothetical protein
MAYASNSKPLELTAVTALAADDTIIVGVTSDLNEVVQTITKANFDADIAITASQVTDFQTAVAANSAVAANTAKVSYTDAAKVAGIEAGADVTDAINVTAAGALMDSEVTNLAQVKAFDTTDYATAAQGATADTAVQPASVDILINKTFDSAGTGNSLKIGSSPVVSTGQTSGQILGYDGTNWIPVANLVAGTGAGAIFFNATPTVTSAGVNNALPILSLTKIPVVTAEQTIVGNAVSNTVAFSAWIDTVINTTTIPAGIWKFDTYAGVNLTTAGRVTTITRQVYAAVPFITGTVTITGTGTSRTATASAGTPFETAAIDASATNTTASYLQTPNGIYQITARTSDTVVTITVPTTYTNESAVAGSTWKKLLGAATSPITDISPAYGLYSVNSTQAAFSVTAVTKLALISFVTSNNTTTATVAYNGTTHNTSVTSTLVPVHNDLVGLQGGTTNENYHLTAAEYTGTGTGVFARKTSPTFVTPVLGTPTSVTLTNATGYPAASTTVVGIVELDTDAEFTTGTDETRYVNAKQVASVAQTQTNKRITKRVGTTTSSATPTIATDSVDYYSLTAQAADITSFTTNLSGTPTNGQTLIIRIKGTAARAITWGASFSASTVALPTTTVTTAMLTVGFIYDSVSATWVCSASA